MSIENIIALICMFIIIGAGTYYNYAFNKIGKENK